MSSDRWDFAFNLIEFSLFLIGFIVIFFSTNGLACGALMTVWLGIGPAFTVIIQFGKKYVVHH